MKNLYPWNLRATTATILALLLAVTTCATELVKSVTVIKGSIVGGTTVTATVVLFAKAPTGGV